jgi:23S rRNA (adenine2030-N6)-methyltransferase
MNYRHAYHAGNFADVLKHATLALVVAYLKRKEAPFRVIDTHAGAGRYLLTSPEAQKTGEWRNGVGRLLGPAAEPLPAAAARALAPYLDVVEALNPSGNIETYPGSPLLALRLIRRQDALIASELHPEARALLVAAIGRDRRAKVLALDGWTAIKSLLPPKERRGLILIDPPFEEAGELHRLAEGLAQGLKRFASGTFLAWYPIKDAKPIVAFHAALAALDVPKLLRVELMLRAPRDADRLNGCGLVVANPPFALAPELAALLPELARRCGEPGAGASHRLDWIGAGTPAEGADEPFRQRRKRGKP